MTLAVGTPAPNFRLRNQHREKVELTNFKGSRTAIVFIPFAFTKTCQGELCEIRDNISAFKTGDVRVVAITCNTLHANGMWANQQGFEFDILSDFWPHGEVARAYETFDEDYGYAKRATYFLDSDLVVTTLIASDELGVARPFSEYQAAIRA